MNSSSNISSAIINTVATVFSFEPALSRGGRKNLSTAGGSRSPGNRGRYGGMDRSVTCVFRKVLT